MHLNEERFQSEAYAMAQQRKYDEEHAKLNQVFEDLKRREPGVFKCGICFDDFQEDVVARVSHAIIHSAGDVSMVMSATDPGVVDEVMLTQLGLSQEQYDIFVEMQLAAFSIIIHCRRCKESIFVDKNEYQETEILVCPLQRCNYTWCKACSQQIDIGGPQHSCDGSSELKHLMGQRGWKHCPGCKTPAEKIEGCNHMTCSAPGCNTHFCYKCGGSIIQSVKREEISTAVSAHFRRLCELFEYPGRLTR
ncbi:hypothetical protein A0H81_03829 [Grifola frondosa]|uniref:RING-type domain-containing protein n=1 Tax=Grifola frondosa TaxID=5627 RepID=A0A1C7MJH9_GRIFR|nr:hypothetical protein A0H81_03829 [Grifola frondosa]